jgi:hypothetical protein
MCHSGINLVITGTIAKSFGSGSSMQKVVNKILKWDAILYSIKVSSTCLVLTSRRLEILVNSLYVSVKNYCPTSITIAHYALQVLKKERKNITISRIITQVCKVNYSSRYY